MFVHGLLVIHDKGIVHRDIKAANVLFDAEGNLKISDFGFAAPMSGWGYISQESPGILYEKKGTPMTYSPEVLSLSESVHENIANNEGYKGRDVDIFSLGFLAFQLVFGSQYVPFCEASFDDPLYQCIFYDRGETFWAMHKLHQQLPVENISADLKMLIFSMLSNQPDIRPSLPDIAVYIAYMIFNHQDKIERADVFR